jgi:hypothetical protein
MIGLTSALIMGLANSGSLALLVGLSGLIYAFTNANDSRVVSKRFILKSDSPPSVDIVSGFLYPDEFVACGGIIGTLLTWFLFPFIYLIFSPVLNRPFSFFLRDLWTSFSLTILGIPVFVLVGSLAVLGTVTYLGFLEKESLTVLSVPTIMTTSLTVFIGWQFFGDRITAPYLAVLLLVASLITWLAYRKVCDTREQVKEQLRENFPEAFPRKERFRTWIFSRVSSWKLALVYIICEIATSVIIRTTLTDIYRRSIGEGFGVALGLRCWYFSIFLIFGLFYVCKWNPRVREKFLVKPIKKSL